MKTKKFTIFNQFAHDYWNNKLQYNEESTKLFESDIIKYFAKVRKIVTETLLLKKGFELTDLIQYLSSTEQTDVQDEHWLRVSVTTAELFDDEYRRLAELICEVPVNLSSCLEDMKIYLIFKIWNSWPSFHNAKTNLLIDNFLADDGEFRELLISICPRGTNNWGFCEWMTENWHACKHLRIQILEKFPKTPHSTEQQELLELVTASD